MKSIYKNLKYFVLFIGYERSGHSLVGALLDAHKNVIIPHEYHVLKKLKERDFETREELFDKLIKRSKWQKNCQEGGRSQGQIRIRNERKYREIIYKYNVPNQYQGDFTELNIIGDKKGDGICIEYENNPSLLTQLMDIIKIPIKYIHVIRNPFDNIGRMGLNRIDEYFTRVKTVENIKRIHSMDVIDIYHENIIKNPTKELLKLTNFLKIETDEKWIQDCASIIFDKPHRSRYTKKWTRRKKNKVLNNMKKYSFFEPYLQENYE